jgi:hypothetical protein
MNSPSMSIGSADMERLRASCLGLRDFLAREKRNADDEIRYYPTPIPRCDAQFNFVYDQRLRLAQLLGHTEAALAPDAPEASLMDAIAEFLSSPPMTENAEEAELRKRLGGELARCAAPPASAGQ